MMLVAGIGVGRGTESLLAGRELGVLDHKFQKFIT